jgi:hypothetical protein
MQIFFPAWKAETSRLDKRRARRRSDREQEAGGVEFKSARAE